MSDVAMEIEIWQPAVVKQACLTEAAFSAQLAPGSASVRPPPPRDFEDQSDEETVNNMGAWMTFMLRWNGARAVSCMCTSLIG
jgi:hypothetical protein